MKSKTRTSALWALTGLALLVGGVVLIALSLVPADSPIGTLPYVLFGGGAMMLGHNLGATLTSLATKNSTPASRQIEIALNDERHLAISTRAKAKAYDMTLLVLGALMLSFAVMPIPRHVLIMFAVAYLCVALSSVYFTWRLHQTM